MCNVPQPLDFARHSTTETMDNGSKRKGMKIVIKAEIS